MPQPLPSSDNIVGDMPIPEAIAASQAAPISPSHASSSGIVVSASGVITGLRNSIMSSGSSIGSRSSASHLSPSLSGSGIDIVVVSSPLSVPITVAHLDTSTQMSPSPTKAPEVSSHKLFDIVTREKDALFHKDQVELEPVRPDVLMVRRKNRPFFALIEVDERDDDRDTSKEDVSAHKKLHLEPTLNLGDTMLRLYTQRDYRNKKTRKGKRSPDREMAKPEFPVGVPDVDRGYESDPEKGLSTLRLIEQVKHGMRRIQSHPELDELVDMNDDVVDRFEHYTRKASSLPTTPNLSPKLARKMMNNTVEEMKTEKTVNPVQHTEQTEGPGISFLASVIGGLRVHKAKFERQRQEEEGMRLEKQQNLQLRNTRESGTVSARGAGMSVTAHTNTDMVTTQTSASNSTARPSGQGKADISESDSKSGFVQNVISWGTKKRVNVSQKETNMCSPSSF